MLDSWFIQHNWAYSFQHHFVFGFIFCKQILSSVTPRNNTFRVHRGDWDFWSQGQADYCRSHLELLYWPLFRRRIPAARRYHLPVSTDWKVPGVSRAPWGHVGFEFFSFKFVNLLHQIVGLQSFRNEDLYVMCVYIYIYIEIIDDYSIYIV